ALSCLSAPVIHTAVNSGMLMRAGSFIATWLITFSGLRQLASPALPSALAADFGVVLFVRHFLEPGDVGAVEMLLQRDVYHRGVGTGAVPVLFPRRDPHRVAGTDLPHRAAPERNPTHAGHDVQGLAPRGAM